MLKGNLSSFHLGEIFQSLAVNNHTGTLKISTRDGVEKCIYFSHGEISLFSSGTRETLLIGEILLRQQKITQAAIDLALQEQKSTGELLGKVLLRKGFITKDDLCEALETKIREEIYDLFLLTDAEFEFYIDHLPEDAFDPLLKNTRISINTSSVILEGIRRVDEWRLIQTRIKSYDEILVPAAGAIQGADLPPDAPELVKRLDGATPVHRLFVVYQGASRFECAKTLYELLESGQIRPITIDEAITGGDRALEAGDPEKALTFFRFADQVDSNRAEVLRPMAVCLRRLEREPEAVLVELRALKIYNACGMHQQALEVGRPLVAPGQKVEPETAEMVFRAAMACGQKDVAFSAADLTARLSLERKNFPKMEAVLEELWSLGSRDLNLRFRLADGLASAGEKEKAVSHLEAIAGELQGQKQIKELVKVLRMMFSLDPRRQDVKQRIQNLLIEQERVEQRKKRRVTITGGTIIAGLLLSMIPLLYELKARELYCHAQRLEEISTISNDFTKVKSAYEQLIGFYCFSTYAGRASDALDRVAGIERIKREVTEREKAVVEKEQERKLQVMREELPRFLNEAKQLEDAGKIQEAFALCTRIASDYADIPGARSVPFPVLVTSSPKGAQVEVNGAVQGTTPIVLHVGKGKELLVNLSRSGCRPGQEKITGGLSWTLHAELIRQPIGEMKVAGAIHQALRASGGRIFFPARDGFLYALSPIKKEVAWQRRVGQFGDLVSEIGAVGQDLLLGTLAGEVLAISPETGKARWRGAIHGAVLIPPVASPDGRWVAAASIDGDVVVFEASEGKVRGMFRAEDEVAGAPLFLEGLLLVGSIDRRLYELDVPTAAPRRAAEFPAPIATSLVSFGRNVILATSDGSLHAYSPREGRVIWSRPLGGEATGPPIVDSRRAYIGTGAGQVVAVDGATGAVAWRLEVSKERAGRLAIGGTHILVGSESGELISIATDTGAREWKFKADAAILAPPLVSEGRLYIACATGKVSVLEMME